MLVVLHLLIPLHPSVACRGSLARNCIHATAVQPQGLSINPSATRGLLSGEPQGSPPPSVKALGYSMGRDLCDDRPLSPWCPCFSISRGRDEAVRVPPAPLGCGLVRVACPSPTLPTTTRSVMERGSSTGQPWGSSLRAFWMIPINPASFSGPGFAQSSIARHRTKKRGSSRKARRHFPRSLL